MAGQMDRIQTLFNVPVLAGDSIGGKVEGIMRLSPLRRPTTLDCKVDFFVFFVPHRYTYGDDWLDFIRQGPDENITLPTRNLTSTSAIYSGSGPVECLGFNKLNGVVPAWVVDPYLHVYDRFFVPPRRQQVQDPSNPAAAADALFHNITSLTDDYRSFGLVAWPLKDIFSTGFYSAKFAASNLDEYRLGASTIASSKVDLVDMEKARQLYESEILREWFAPRYQDLMPKLFGTKVAPEITQQPRLCFHNSSWMSGKDVAGTDDATLGTLGGVSSVGVNWTFPRKYFSEHGALLGLCLARYPRLFTRATHYLVKKPQPTYLEISGDPKLMAAEPPHQIKLNELTDASSSNSDTIGYQPYGQWHRYHPHRVHSALDDVQGFPINNKLPNADGELTSGHSYLNPVSYFSTTQLAHWQINGLCKISAARVIPPGVSSIYSGTR